MKSVLTTAAILVLATSTAFAGKGDRPYYCPASVSAAGSWAQPECAGASESLRKRLGIGEYAPTAKKKKK